MKIVNEIVMKKINEIKPYERNPRKNDEAVKYVAESIKQFGFKVPIVIDKDGVIVAGHTRYKASKKLGLEKVPCIIADDLNEEQIKAYRLADNKVSEMAEWDDELLNFELEKIIDINMIDFGFELDIEEDITKKERKEVNLNEEEYQIIIDCENEEDMRKKYELIKECGLECRLSTL